MKFLITSKRLRIRQFKTDDLEEFISFMTDRGSTKFLTFDDDQKTRKGATDLLKATIDSYGSDNPMMAFAVEDNESKEFIGFCGLTPRESDSVEIMYAIKTRARGNGYAAEIASELANHAIRQLGYSRVIAPISPKHSASKAVAVKAGFTDRGLQQVPGSADDIHLFVYENN